MNFPTKFGLSKRWEHDPTRQNCFACGGDGRETYSKDCPECSGRGWIASDEPPKTEKPPPEHSFDLELIAPGPEVVEIRSFVASIERGMIRRMTPKES